MGQQVEGHSGLANRIQHHRAGKGRHLQVTEAQWDSSEPSRGLLLEAGGLLEAKAKAGRWPPSQEPETGAQAAALSLLSVYLSTSASRSSPSAKSLVSVSWVFLCVILFTNSLIQTPKSISNL
jgi:hypothetical protein